MSFNQQGQWTLNKATQEVGVLKDPAQTAPGATNKPFRSISTSTEEGRLPEDRGQRGTLHNFGQGKRPKPSHLTGQRKWGQPTHPVSSAYANQNPGVANPTV